MSTSTRVFAILGVIAASILAVMVLPIIMALGGMFAGLMVGWAFPATTVAFLGNIGMSTLSFWQFGGMLAFVGAFLRTTVNQTKI